MEPKVLAMFTLVGMIGFIAAFLPRQEDGRTQDDMASGI
jgi:hypothetical protein